MAGQTQRPSRFKELQVVAPGAGGSGHEPSVGAGAIVPFKIIIPAGQSVDTFEVVTAAGVVLFKIDKSGAIASGPGSAAGLGNLGVAHAVYSFATDGGASCTPALNATIPANAILIGATVNVPTAVTASGSATVGIGTTAGSTTTSILAATGKASLTIDALINGVPTLAAPVKMSAAGQISVLIATGPLLTGIVEIFVYYVLAQNA
jgi:hypothetical protein